MPCKPPPNLFPDLYLPTGPRTLLAALASALANEHQAEILYLEDGSPLPASVKANIQQKFPSIVLKCGRDSAAIEEFASLPRWFPAILRRNLAFLPNGRPVRPQSCPGAWMGAGYRHAHVYLTGNFISKTLRGRCRTIILREEGLSSYHGLSVGWAKSMLRGLVGRSPRRHFMGEESWIDRIEIARPNALPPRLRAKASPFGLIELRQALPDGTARLLAEAFWTGPLPPPVKRRALLLTQPVDIAGLVDNRGKREIYVAIIAELEKFGYRVLIKPHPHEATPPGPYVLPSFFPIEAWSWMEKEPFDLAVALCSSALEADGAGFSRCSLQLVSPERFKKGNFEGWQERLQEALSRKEGLSSGSSQMS